jgi:hypothetical protein
VRSARGRPRETVGASPGLPEVGTEKCSDAAGGRTRQDAPGRNSPEHVWMRAAGFGPFRVARSGRVVPRVKGNSMRAMAAERRYGSSRGESSEGKNPKDVTGMKQGRTVRRGAKRCEGEKPWERNTRSEANSGIVAPPILQASKGRQTPGEVLLPARSRDPGGDGSTARQYSEEGATL